MGALEGLASPANGPIGAAAAGSSTAPAPSTSTAGSDATMAALSARIRDLEAGLASAMAGLASARTDLASARTDLASVRTDLSGTQVSLGLAVIRLERSESRARFLAGQATDNEEGIRAVAELVGQWAGRQMNRDEVCTFFLFSRGHN